MVPCNLIVADMMAVDMMLGAGMTVVVDIAAGDTMEEEAAVADVKILTRNAQTPGILKVGTDGMAVLPTTLSIGNALLTRSVNPRRR